MLRRLPSLSPRHPNRTRDRSPWNWTALAFSAWGRESGHLHGFDLHSAAGPSSSRNTVLTKLSSRTVVDVVVYGLILALTSLSFYFCEKAPGFVKTDVHYADLADSLLHSHYATNFTAERLQPPGFPLILAFIAKTIGSSHDTFLRAMPVFLALGLLLCYEVLRRQGGRFIAAAICLLMAASPSLFGLVTSWIFPAFAYFFVSMAILLLMMNLQASQRKPLTITLVIGLSLLLSLTVMIESAGIAFIAAIFTWLALSFFGNRQIAWRRVKRFLPIAIVALSIEGVWLHQGGGNSLEWALPGYPQGYFAQLKVKNGNNPELGFATAKDVVSRVRTNLQDRVTYLGQVFFQYRSYPPGTSPLVAGFTILILCGVGAALRRSRLQFCALYFLFYEVVHLLWPWNFETRFAMAILPLACFYLVEGLLALWRWSRLHPRTVGALILSVSTVLARASAQQAWTAQSNHAFEEKVSMLFWIFCAVLGLRLLWKRSLPAWADGILAKSYSVVDWKRKKVVQYFRPVQLVALWAITYLVVAGVAAEIPIGRENLVAGFRKFQNEPEIQAARWIDAHTDPDTVIAASLQPIFYHYTRRKVIWFPPISNPATLMAGLLKHHVAYVVVVDRDDYYYLPSETTCFDLLKAAYPQAFRLAVATGQAKIYELIPEATAQAHTSLDSPLDKVNPHH
jgi:hypothetical protein